MLTEAVQSALNGQIRAEFDSAYVYLSMAAHFDSVGLPGASHWMRHQAKEELEHGMKLYDYVLDRGGNVALEAIDAPPSSFGSPLAVFEAAYEHERTITGSIHALHELAGRERDLATQRRLQWFIDEQVEEEKSAAGLVAMMKRAGDDRAAQLVVDQHLAARGD